LDIYFLSFVPLLAELNGQDWISVCGLHVCVR